MHNSPDTIDAFRKIFIDQKNRAQRALAQLTTDELHQSIAPGINPIAVIVKHLQGNMRSRWTDFLTTDGEKPWRQRDDEFVDDNVDHAEVMRRFNDGWSTVFAALDALSDADLSRTVHIRGEPHTVTLAMLRQVDHYAYHIGQIVTFARIIKGDQWRHLSIPPGKGQSLRYNQMLGYEP